MKYIHGIVVVNRPDLLRLAVKSVKPLWPSAFILDNSPGGWIGKRHRWPIPVVRPSVPLSCAQSMNFLQRLACEKRADVFGYQHNDAEALDDCLNLYLRTVGEWDTAFPQPNYHIDVDWFHRARLKGYELIESSGQVKHHEGASSTVKSDPHLSQVNGVTFSMNETYYMAKWGGPPHQEVFASAWNG